MVAGKNEVQPAQRKGQVIGGMTRGGDRLQGPAVTGDGLPVGDGEIGDKAHIGGSVERIGLADVERPCRPVAAGTDRLGAGRLDQAFGGAGMIEVGVGDEDVRNRTPGCGGEQCRDMGGIVRPGVDDGERRLADDMAVGPVKGERSGVARGHAPDGRRDLHRVAVIGRSLALEEDIRHNRHRSYRECRGAQNSPVAGGTARLARNPPRRCKLKRRAEFVG